MRLRGLPQLKSADVRRLSEDFEEFHDGLPDPIEVYLRSAYGLDLESEYGGLKIKNPFGKAVFGADRSALLRALASAAPNFTLVIRECGDLAGYAFGRRGSRADHLGPWIPKTESAAGELIEQFLRHCSPERLFVGCLKSSPWAKTLLRARGFEFSWPLTRMYRSPNDHPGRPGWLCAILGPEFG